MNGSKSERLARLEEKHAAIVERVTAIIKALEERVTTQEIETRRRLTDLNGEQARIAKMQSEMQSKEQARSDLDKAFAKIDANDSATDQRLKTLEGTGREAKGKEWLPNIVIGAIALGIGAALVKLLFP